MLAITLKAHFDGKTIQLDEPYEMPPNTPVVVIVADPSTKSEREIWEEASAITLGLAYGDDEPEYTLDDIKP